MALFYDDITNAAIRAGQYTQVHERMVIMPDQEFSFFREQDRCRNLDTSELFELLRIVRSNLRLAGSIRTFYLFPTGFSWDREYRIGKQIAPGNYSMRLPGHINCEAGKSSYIYLFEDMDAYRKHRAGNGGHLGIIPTWSIYRDVPVSSIELSEGVYLVIQHNPIVLSKFQPISL